MKSKQGLVSKTIPILDLKREYAFLNKDIKRQLSECFKSQHWILGGKVEALQDKIASLIKVKFCRGVASGTDALAIALRALAMRKSGKYYFKPSDEIITTPFTFVATAEAIYRSGARPVFVDIDPETFNIDPQAVKKAISKRTAGVLPVHLYGQSCLMDELKTISKKHGLFMVEDCAQSFLAAFRSAKTGSLSDCGAFSFFPSKILGCFGDGGCITTNDPLLAKNIDILRLHGQSEYADALCIGYNSRLDAMQAAILLAKLDHIEMFIQRRRELASIYDGYFKGSPYIKPPVAAANCWHVYGLYTVKVLEQRDQLLAHLNKQGVGARIYYHKPLYQMRAFKNAKVCGSMSGVKSLVDKVMSLPLYPFLREGELKRVVKTIDKFYNKL